MNFNSKKNKDQKKRSSWRDALDDDGDADADDANKKPKVESESLSRFKAELAERENIESQNKQKYERIEAALARVEGRTDALGQYVWMDVEISGQKVGDQTNDPTTGRLVIEVFDDLFPDTGRAFIEVVRNQREPMFSGCKFRKVVKGKFCELSSSTTRSRTFPNAKREKDSDMLHTVAGVVSLVRPEEHGAFSISFGPCEELDGNVVIGRVAYGQDLLNEISLVGDKEGEARRSVQLRETDLCDNRRDVTSYLKPMFKPKEIVVHKRTAVRKGNDASSSLGGPGRA